MKNTSMLALAAFGAAFTLTASAQSGYATQGGSTTIWMNPYGLCWHSGFWTEQDAVSPCDKAAQITPVAAPAPAPAPVQQVAEPKVEPAPAPAPVAAASAPVAVPVAAQPSYEKVTLSADVLFDFGKSTLKDAGKAKLDELADRLSGATLDQIKIVGHADRIGSPQHNKRLSEARAETVREYLQTRTNARTFEIAGKGSTQPVSSCKGLGADQGSNRRLVQCLQADRRVEIELFGVRTAGQRPGEPAAGATQPTNYAR